MASPTKTRGTVFCDFFILARARRATG